MNRIGMSICAVVCFGMLSLSCVAQANPWNGSFKVDPGTMKYNGPTFTIATDAEGFTVTRGKKTEPKVVCDGKARLDKGEMVSCTKTAKGYALEMKRDGRLTDKVTMTLAGKRMIARRIEVFPKDGKPFTIKTWARRVSGGPDFDGVFKETRFEESQDTGILSIEVQGDSVAFKETDSDQPVTCKLDGTPTKIEGDRTMSVKLDGKHTLKVTYRDQKGKLQRENTFVLSSNGKKITETDVTPAPSHSTMTLEFTKS